MKTPTLRKPHWNDSAERQAEYLHHCDNIAAIVTDTELPDDPLTVSFAASVRARVAAYLEAVGAGGAEEAVKGEAVETCLGPRDLKNKLEAERRAGIDEPVFLSEEFLDLERLNLNREWLKREAERLAERGQCPAATSLDDPQIMDPEYLAELNRLLLPKGLSKRPGWLVELDRLLLPEGTWKPHLDQFPEGRVAFVRAPEGTDQELLQRLGFMTLWTMGARVAYRVPSDWGGAQRGDTLVLRDPAGDWCVMASPESTRIVGFSVEACAQLTPHLEPVPAPPCEGPMSREAMEIYAFTAWVQAAPNHIEAAARIGYVQGWRPSRLDGVKRLLWDRGVKFCTCRHGDGCQDCAEAKWEPDPDKD